MASGLRNTCALGTALVGTVGAGLVGSSGVAVADGSAPTLTLVSHGPGHALGDGLSWEPALSGNGRVVGFASRATNLPAAGARTLSQVFLWARPSDYFFTASADLAADPAGSADEPALSRTGRYVAFSSDARAPRGTPAGRMSHVYRFDRATGRMQLVDSSRTGRPGNGPAAGPSISSTGRFVAFQSNATNLTGPAPADRSVSEVYVRDTVTGRTSWVSSTEDGRQGRWGAIAPDISANGTVVTFWSRSPLVRPDDRDSGDVFVKNLRTGRLTRVPLTHRGGSANRAVGLPVLSPDGRYVAFDVTGVGAEPGSSKMYVYDRRTARTQGIDVSPFGPGVRAGCRVAGLSYDARYVMFDSRPVLGIDIPLSRSAFVLDRATGRVRRIAGIGPDAAGVSAGGLSWDGRYATVELDRVINRRSERTRSEIYLADLGR